MQTNKQTNKVSNKWKMEVGYSWPYFDANERERYRNPAAPLGYRQLYEPDVVRRLDDDPDEIVIPIQEWIDHIDFFNEDTTSYETFKINTDSEAEEEDDEIVEVPFVPVEKNIESICISDSDDEVVLVDNVIKEKEIKAENKTKDTENSERIDSSKKKEIKAESQPEKKSSAKDDKAKRKQEKHADQRIGKKELNKAIKDIIKQKTADSKERTSEKIDRHRDKKTSREEEGSRHKKDKPKIETISEKTHRSKPRRDSVDSDSEDQRRRGRKGRSPSPEEEHYREDRKKDYSYFKEEYDEDYFPGKNIKEEYPTVHGVYHCDICNLTLNSYVTYQSHIVGKRHKKNIDAKNVAQAVAKSYVPIKPASKIANPPLGYIRIESNSTAKIQHVIEDKLQIPCPGLHKVIEIQSILETSYYCTLCDAPCGANSILPHLSGFKHQLNILKYYDSKLYDEISYKQKYQIESLVSQKLKAFEKKHGKGLLKVERDVPDNGTYDRASIPSTSSTPDLSFVRPTTSSRPSTSRPSSSSRDQPRTSKETDGGDFLEKYQSYSQPDPNKAGFYCTLCLSHSNSKQMWEAHISGKRHITNLKKAPGTAPSKSRNIPAPPGTVARLWEQLDGIEEPIVGLDQIREIQRMDTDSVSYTCFLCGGISVIEGDIVDHILLTKHREKYLEKIQFPELETLRNCQMSDFGLSSVIAEMCETVEKEEGRGRPEVYYAKNSIGNN